MIYDPANLRIPNAWNISEEAWAQSVFTMDIHYLDKARAMVLVEVQAAVLTGKLVMLMDICPLSLLECLMSKILV